MGEVLKHLGEVQIILMRSLVVVVSCEMEVCQVCLSPGLSNEEGETFCIVLHYTSQETF